MLPLFVDNTKFVYFTILNALISFDLCFCQDSFHTLRNEEITGFLKNLHLFCPEIDKFQAL